MPPDCVPPLPNLFPIIWQDSAGYERARVGRIFNYRRPSRYPLAIVEPTTEDHVVEAVRLAKHLNCRVSIRSGGHSWAGWSVRDDAILIDFGRFHYLDLDETTGILATSPNMTGKLINRLLEPRGRWFPGGHCPDVGNWGWACERIKAIDVVTADGQRLRCDEDHNSDLFWAARGAGPGFPAIVTRFYVQTELLKSHARESTYVWDKKHYHKVLEWVTKVCDPLSPTFDTDTEIVAIASHVPGLEGVHIIARFVTFKNSQADAEAALKPAHESAPPDAVISSFCTETSLNDQNDIQHAANPEGHRYHVDNCYIDNDADVVSVMEKSFVELPTSKTFTLWYSMAPGSRRSTAEGTMKDMAVSMQTDHYFAVYAVCEKPEEDKKCAAWVRQVLRDMQPHISGAYLGDADFQVRLTKYWADPNACRLMEIRLKWDPNGLVAGYLTAGDDSGPSGLANEHDWQTEFYFMTAPLAAAAACSPYIGPANGTLVIVGGGSLSDSIYQRFIALAGGEDAPIVVVPTAGGEPTYNDNEAHARSLRQLGAKKVTVLHTYDPKVADTEEFARPLLDAKGVWFGGGRQWRLVDAYAGTLTEKAFWAVLDRNGAIGGTSAGATIQGSFLARGDTQNNQIMIGDHTEGFGFVKDIAIDQHVLARNRHFDMFDILKVYPDLLGVSVDENTALIVSKNDAEVFGASHVIFYDGTFWSREGSELKNLPEPSSLFYFLRNGDKYDLKERKVVD
ncbi:FAD-linked oxidoreductase penO [Paramyrothecium foliicola]|nr:FAD-linked oxidoreductase penO [Paramyrothecium foliicola]